MTTATARAHSNIALIKYWGKRDAARNLPAAGSISITLEGLHTDTRVDFDPTLAADTCELDGEPVATERMRPLLDHIRARAAIESRARIITHNNFPTGAGLASSASGFAALTLAATAAAGLQLSRRQLSTLARLGSGSAARSLFGGYVEMLRGSAADGHDAHAVPLLDAADWPLAVVVAITDADAKAVDSRRGMTASAAGSPFYASWLRQTDADLVAMRAIIAQHDFHALGALAEHNCLKMHALMLSTQPALLYWNGATVNAMHALRALRKDGVPVYFTIDAGPQIKALCPPEFAATTAATLAAVPGVQSVLRTGLGPGAHLLS